MLLDDHPSETDEAKAAALIDEIRAARGSACRVCARRLCGHEIVFVSFLGFKDAPRCVACLAGALGRERGAFLEEALAHIQRRACFRAGWDWASADEGFAALARPRCLWPEGSPAAAPATTASVSATADAPAAGASVGAFWDAGDMGCGDLVLELRARLRPLAPAAVLRLVARDPGAPVDLPAWCRLTGHVLLRAAHPDYWIQRRDGP